MLVVLFERYVLLGEIGNAYYFNFFFLFFLVQVTLLFCWCFESSALYPGNIIFTQHTSRWL